MAVSPTAEGFRAAFRRPSLTFAEIAWRWTVGGTATALFFFGLFEYLDNLPVTSGELLFLRTRQPYLVAEAIAHIFRGTLNRVAVAGILAVFLLAVLWIVAGSSGRIATVRALLDYFHRNVTFSASADGATDSGERDVASHVSTSGSRAFATLVRLNFLRATVALAAAVGMLGAAILAGFASPAADPQPGLAFMLFLPLAAMVCLAWAVLNWLLSLAGMFSVRDGVDAGGAISAAVTLCRERTGAVFAVSAWTGLAHVVAFVGASVVASIPLGLSGVLPWRLVLVGTIFVTLLYFALADWFYMARLGGYVCIAEMPPAIPAPVIPAAQPYVPPQVMPPAPPVQSTPIQTSIDRDEPILSDLPNLPIQFVET
jgi:hypothetical protein